MAHAAPLVFPNHPNGGISGGVWPAETREVEARGDGEV
jgi:hypothetical protein